MEAFADLILPPELALDAEPFSDQDVDDSLASEDGSAVSRWSIADDSMAEWAMRKLAAIVAEERALEARRDEWTARIAVWFDRRHAVLVPRRQFFEGHLERYQETRRQVDPKAKTLVLPSGEVRSRAVAAKAVVENVPAFVRWALEHAPEVLETVHKVVHRDFVARFAPLPPAGDTAAVVVDKTTGEALEVPGVISHPGSVSYSAVPGA